MQAVQVIDHWPAYLMVGHIRLQEKSLSLPQNFMTRTEQIISARSDNTISGGSPDVVLRTFVSEACGAANFSTGTATFQGGAYLPYHMHAFSEAVTVLQGHARLLIEDRAYILGPRDCVHLPAHIPHLVQNESPARELVAHWAFATGCPKRELIDHAAKRENLIFDQPGENDPEHIVRYATSTIYELSENALFCDLFARRFGAIGICGGYGRFLPGTSLPCHIHDFDESITIVQGRATCLVQGRQYELSGCDTAFIPKGFPHRFLNNSEEEMAMVWVYASSEPDRTLVDFKLCSGKPTELGASDDTRA